MSAHWPPPRRDADARIELAPDAVRMAGLVAGESAERSPRTTVAGSGPPEFGGPGCLATNFRGRGVGGIVAVVRGLGGAPSTRM